MESFLSFVDSFFNGLMVNYLVQSKIADAREQAETAIRYIEPIVNQLRQQMQERKGDIYGMPWEYVMVCFWRGNQWA